MALSKVSVSQTTLSGKFLDCDKRFRVEVGPISDVGAGWEFFGVDVVDDHKGQRYRFAKPGLLHRSHMTNWFYMTHFRQQLLEQVRSLSLN